MFSLCNDRMLRLLGLETAEEAGKVSLGSGPTRGKRLAIRVPCWLVGAGVALAASRLGIRARLIFGLAFPHLLSALPLDEGVARAARHGALYSSLLGIGLRLWHRP